FSPDFRYLWGIGLEKEVVVVIDEKKARLVKTLDLAGRPLQDERVTVREVDVAQILKVEHRTCDAILLDVDNGPDGLTRKGNDWLYTQSGIEAAHAALRPGGALAVWSAGVDTVFIKRLRRAGFRVEEHRVRARGSRGGSRYIVWIALK
ncbi:hypothetical protein LCGC14_2499540, partial [marine sediment metagenome]